MARKPKVEAADHQQEHENDPVLVPDLSKVKGLSDKMKKESLGTDQLEWSEIRETICGTTDDSQPVEQYDGTLGVSTAFVNANQRPVGVLRWHSDLASKYTNPGNVAGQRWCTGTLITNNLFLTAGHCFDQTGGGWQRPRVNGTTNIIEPEEIALNMSVEFNFQHDPSGVVRTPTSVQVVELVEYRLGGLDFAIARLEGSPGVQWGTTGMAPDDGSVGDMMCIIGHPAGQPKRIEAGPLTSFDGHRVRYNDIDTLGGNSGSGILRESDGCIIGIHTNGGCNAAMTGSNFGVRISHVRNASPTIQSISAHTNTILDQLTTQPAVDQLRTRPALDQLRTRPAVDQIRTTTIADRLTLTVADRNTNPIRDRITTVLADRNTSVIRDIRGTSPVLDQGGTNNKALDDVKVGARDKQFSDRKLPGQDVGFDPGGGIIRRRLREQGAQPFILATPHHVSDLADESGLSEDELVYAYEEALAELEAAMDSVSAEYAELEQEYAAVAEEYQNLLG